MATYSEMKLEDWLKKAIQHERAHFNGWRH